MNFSPSDFYRRFSQGFLWVLFIQFVFILGCTKRIPAEKQIPTPSAFSQVDESILNQSAHAETVYVPVYSHLAIGEKGILSLRAILSMRNTSDKESLILSKIEYYDTNGKLLKSYLQKPVQLEKMATMEVEISSLDLSGGSGANFVVKWSSTNKISSPIIETLMYGASGPQSFAFISRGQVIERH
jgi:hypothetical protein